VPFRSLRNRLALLFGLIVLGAIGVVYFSTVPELEGALREQKLEDLTEDVTAYGPRLQRTIGTDTPQSEIDDRVQRAASESSARVTLFSINEAGSEPTATVNTDSDPEAVAEQTTFAVVQEALRTRRIVTGSEPTNRGRIAEVGMPLIYRDEVARVLVFSDDLGDVQSNVDFIRRQLLVSGAVALAVAILAGFLVARALSARVERLEQAVRRVAAGDFSDRIAADSDDELGRLGAAFDDMQRQLAQLDGARKQFIATASHELRTPIFSLGGFIELLADEELDEETRRQFIEQVQGQVERLRNLTTELLDLSRLEAGSLELRPEPTDVGSLARDVTGEFTPALARHHSEVQLRLGREPIEVECDPERVAQVLRILMDNALVHTPPGTDITVSAARENGAIRLAVTDTGLGIRRQTMPRIFEPFFTSNEDAQGAGLGLTIARELAERMQGSLTARSVPGSTTFTLTLPT